MKSTPSSCLKGHSNQSNSPPLASTSTQLFLVLLLWVSFCDFSVICCLLLHCSIAHLLWVVVAFYSCCNYWKEEEKKKTPFNLGKKEKVTILRDNVLYPSRVCVYFLIIFVKKSIFFSPFSFCILVCIFLCIVMHCCIVRMSVCVINKRVNW